MDQLSFKAVQGQQTEDHDCISETQVQETIEEIEDLEISGFARQPSAQDPFQPSFEI